MLIVNNLSKAYKKKLIGPFNFSIDNNETIAIIGRSGSGKSTLVKLMTNFIDSDSGNVLFNNSKLNKDDYTYISQSGTLFNHLTIKDNLYLTYNGNTDFVIKSLDEVGLNENFLEKYPFELSGGEKQRIDLIRAIISKSKIIILDEAFSALDSSTKDDIYEVLKNMRKNYDLIIIFITHDLDEAMFLGDKIMLLEDGKVLFNDIAKNLLTVDPKTINTSISEKRLNRMKKIYLED